MPLLPPLGDRAAPRLLPLAPGTAARLANALLGDPDEAPHRFEAALRNDPPLTLWTICRADADGARLPTLPALAAWLREHGLDALRWEEPKESARGEPAGAELYSDSLVTADLAARLATKAESDLVEEARLLGQVHNARAWLSLHSGTSVVDRSRPTGVQWLDDALRRLRGKRRLESSDAAGYVQEARNILSGAARPPSGLGFDRRRAKREASAAFQRWSGGEAVDLPALTGRLRTLRDREGDFQERLEAEKLEAMAEFAAGAGHEINNPIAVISGRAQLLGRGEADPQRKRDLALIGAQARRVYEMIADMMLFARPPQPEFRAVDLAALLDEAWPRWQAAAEDRGFRLARTGEAGPLIVLADRDQLLVALGALVDNALQLEQGSLVEIGAARLTGDDLTGNGASQSQAGPFVQLTVRDDGPGIAPDIRRHLFDPYFSGRAAGRGLGLGLSKCWRIVTRHGGRLTVASRPGGGSEFALLLPAQREEATR